MKKGNNAQYWPRKTERKHHLGQEKKNENTIMTKPRKKYETTILLFNFINSRLCLDGWYRSGLHDVSLEARRRREHALPGRGLPHRPQPGLWHESANMKLSIDLVTILYYRFDNTKKETTGLQCKVLSNSFVSINDVKASLSLLRQILCISSLI